MENLKKYIVQIRGVSFKPNECSNEEKEGYIPLLRANNIKDSKINYDKLIFVKKEKVKDVQLLKKGDILICTSNGSKNLVGKSAIIREDIYCTFGAFCKVIRTTEKLNPFYLSCFFESDTYRNLIQHKSNGANINNLKNEDFDNLLLNICDYNEQKKIVEEFDLIFDLIENKRKQIIDLKQLLKSYFNEMFENKNFEFVAIKDIVDNNVIKVKKKFSSNDIIKYIDISSIDNEKNVVIGYSEYELQNAPSRAQQCITKNDILISTVRPNLKNIAVNEYDYSNCVGTSGFCVLRAINCNHMFLKYIVLSDKFTNDMVKLTTGANYPAIRDKDIKEYRIINPPIELQNEFAKIVELIEKQLNICERQLEKLINLKKSKLQEYFGGNINE